MKLQGIRKLVVAQLVALSLTFGVVASAHAVTIGAGTGILTLDGPNNQVDTPTDGTNDQSRQNLDETFGATLEPGEYFGSSWTYQEGQTGSVTPYIAVSTGDDAYQIVAVGDQVDIDDSGLNVDVTVPFGGSSFTLDAATEVFAGIVNPTEIGSQNPIWTNLNSGSTVDHDNNADGMLSPAVVGGAVDGFGHANLARSYAFSIEVDAVPEPSSIFLTVVAVALAGLGLRRRR